MIVRKLFGENPITVMVNRERAEFDAEGVAEVSEEAAKTFSQIPGYEVEGELAPDEDDAPEAEAAPVEDDKPEEEAAPVEDDEPEEEAAPVEDDEPEAEAPAAPKRKAPRKAAPKKA